MENQDQHYPGEFNSALHARCPKCRTGSIFSTKMYTLPFQKMNRNCPYCNFEFEIEPGYFYVAMFVSYAINVAIMISVGVAVGVLTGTDNPWVYLAFILGTSFLISPVNFRYSRVILLYWLTPGLHFEPDRITKHKELAKPSVNV